MCFFLGRQGGRSDFSACRLWKKLVYQLCGHTLPISIERLQARNGSRICASHHSIMCQSPRESLGRRFYWNRKMQRKKPGKRCVCWWNQLEDQHPRQFAQQSRFGMYPLGVDMNPFTGNMWHPEVYVCIERNIYRHEVLLVGIYTFIHTLICVHC